MIVVSDSSVAVAFQHLSLIPVLQKLYGEVIIPQAVFDDLSGSKILTAQSLALYPFIRIHAINDTQLAKSLQKILDKGESEAIVAYKECRADYLLIDEQDGRKVATELGVRIKGTLDILPDAKTHQLIPAIKPLLSTLVNNLDFRISK
jgi:uncharacterized protein